MKIYLADLQHDYLGMRQYVPLNIGYLAAYANLRFEGEISFTLTTSFDELIDLMEQSAPDLVGLTNYTWNQRLSAHAGRLIKTLDPAIPIVMGGPNIGLDVKDIRKFLEENEYIDKYCLFNGELPFYEIVDLIDKKADTVDILRKTEINSTYSLYRSDLIGNKKTSQEKDLDYAPSPYTSGLLDKFLNGHFIPLFESNRGCPYKCTFCYWGVEELNRLKKFSLERIKSEISYVLAKAEYPQVYLVDANFGILKRDLEIAQHLRQQYEKTKSFSFVYLSWAKVPLPHMAEVGKALGKLCNTYIAFQSLDDDVLSAMKRKNISVAKLSKLIADTEDYTHKKHTDILLGTPNETLESHLRSLDGVIDLGIDHILGGEVQLLPGTDMATQSSRKTFGIVSKHRLFRGAYGFYRDQLIYEVQEVIRQTNTMTEAEMIWLRVFRAIFFGCITLSEFKNLITFFQQHDLTVTQVLRHVIDRRSESEAFTSAYNWLKEEAEQEFFSTLEDIDDFIHSKEHDGLFGQNTITKLNYGFLARICLRREEYNGFYKVLEHVLCDLLPEYPHDLISHLISYTKARNYVNRCLDNDVADFADLKISGHLANVLFGSNVDEEAIMPIRLKIDAVTAKEIKRKFDFFGTNLNTYAISQIFEIFAGRTHMEIATILSESQHDNYRLKQLSA